MIKRKYLPLSWPMPAAHPPGHISLHRWHILVSGWAGSSPATIRGTAGSGAQGYAEGIEKEGLPSEVIPSLNRQPYRTAENPLTGSKDMAWTNQGHEKLKTIFIF